MLPIRTPLELASGEVFGTVRPEPLPPVIGSADPRLALEEVVRQALDRSPCGVAFSGGRDSSLILAVAVHVARREGLPLPIPHTLRFRDADDSQEAVWQELVIRHLNIDSWEIIELDDELDLVGELGQSTLRRFGPSCHPQLHFDRLMIERLRGGVLLSGEYGDDLFDDRRIALALHSASRFYSKRRLGQLLSAAWQITPTPLRAAVYPRRAAQSWRGSYPWLRPEAESEVIRRSSLEYGSEPFGWRAWIDWSRRQRSLGFDIPFQKALNDDLDLLAIDPLWEPSFLAHLRLAGRGVGWPDRTAAFTMLAADLLPPEVLGRESKASFQDAFVGRPTRQLLANWDGSGVDPNLVDTDALRRTWAEDFIDARTYGLVRSVWLAANR